MSEERIDNVETGTEQEQQEEKVLTFTQEELDALIQSKSDQRVSQALKTAEKKKAQAVKEAEKLAKLSEQERYEYELQQREQKLIEKERQMAILENKAEASKALSERHISPALTELVVAEDADTMMENIKLLDDVFKECVKKEVELRLAGSSPKKNLGDGKGMTREEFMKLSLAKQSELLNENPETYEKFL